MRKRDEKDETQNTTKRKRFLICKKSDEKDKIHKTAGKALERSEYETTRIQNKPCDKPG